MLFRSQGFGEAIEEVHQLWQSGKRDAAAAKVPIEIGMHTNLLGDDDSVTERLRRYRDVGVGTIRVSIAGGDETSKLDSLDRLMDLVDTVNAE